VSWAPPTGPRSRTAVNASVVRSVIANDREEAIDHGADLLRDFEQAEVPGTDRPGDDELGSGRAGTDKHRSAQVSHLTDAQVAVAAHPLPGSGAQSDAGSALTARSTISRAREVGRARSLVRERLVEHGREIDSFVSARVRLAAVSSRAVLVSVGWAVVSPALGDRRTSAVTPAGVLGLHEMQERRGCGTSWSRCACQGAVATRANPAGRWGPGAAFPCHDAPGRLVTGHRAREPLQERSCVGLERGRVDT